MRLIQLSCQEGNKIDERQAKSVLRHRPDAIVFEAPSDIPGLSLPYNKYPPSSKPVKLVYAHQNKLRKVAKSFPWTASDIGVYDNILQLWSEGHDVKLYHIDGPSELLQETINRGWNKTAEPRRRGTHFPWWVYIYLRERIMTNNLERIMPVLPTNATVLIFLQKFHWLHLHYLIQNPPKRKIFQYYFDKFNVTPLTINRQVENIHNPVLTKYWKQYSDFT